MRSSLFLIAPFVAAASAASSVGTTTVTAISGSETVVSTYTYTYSNPATAFLTETNSAGIITGHPRVGQPGLATSQPPVATIPAGLPKGVTALTIAQSGSVDVFSVSVGPSTTIVLGSKVGAGKGGSASASGAPSSSAAAGGKGGKGGSKKGGSNNGGSQSSSSSSDNAAPTSLKAASAGIIGLGAVVAALL